jgi:flagellar biosynthesis protein FlhG
MADLASRQRHELLEQLATLERVAHTIIIDTGAGISENVLALAGGAHTTLVTITPEPTAITDGYGIIKALARRSSGADIQLLVNMAAHNAEGESVFARVNRVSRTFLNRPLQHAGTVPNDDAVRDAVRQRVPFLLSAPESPAAQAVRQLARRLAGVADEASESGRGGFFSRLAAWLTGAAAGETANPANPAKVARPVSPISR